MSISTEYPSLASKDASQRSIPMPRPLDEAAPEEAPQFSFREPEPEPEPSPEPPEDPEPPRKKRPRFWVLIGVLTAAVIAALVAFVLLPALKEDRPDTPEPEKNSENPWVTNGELLAKKSWYERGSLQNWFQYTYDAAGRLTKEEWFASDGRRTQEISHVYDEAGNETESVTSLFLYSDVIATRIRYERNEAGDLMAEENYNNLGNLDSWDAFHYDDGKLAEKKHYEAESTEPSQPTIAYGSSAGGDGVGASFGARKGKLTEQTLYEYDADGNLTKETVLDGYGVVIKWTELTYDAAGHEIRYREFIGNGPIKEWHDSVYDETGHLVKTVTYNGDNTVDTWTEYQNDAAGHPMKATDFRSDGILDSRTDEYNSAGNLVRETTFRGDGTELLRCEYEYVHAPAGN